MRFECNGPPNPPSRMVPSEQQPWVGEFGSWHRRLLDNATSVRRRRRRREESDSTPIISILNVFVRIVKANVTTACYFTCGTLLELLIFLFPPLPGLEDAPQAGQLAVTADGWSVDPRHQATRS